MSGIKMSFKCYRYNTPPNLEIVFCGGIGNRTLSLKFEL